ncbi:GNAT family N-acetyltransferase [Nocardioides sp. LS1]|uniref:GNAT family N-acetyltransferase n=1 Tax=Nocardioides sp. LS1 TaxID=1027620 RepID=UPI000F616ED2|nr:GNAT family N-acetyltransferase [Nocardioides sp. LS1]
MVPLQLDASLASEFSVGPAADVGVDEAFALVEAELTATFGFCPATTEDIRSYLQLPATTRSDQLVVRDRTGRLVQWCYALRDSGATMFFARVRTHPDLPGRVGDLLAGAGYDALLGWVRDEAAGEGQVVVQSMMARGDLAAERRLRAAGFVHERTLWEMVAPVAAVPDGLREHEGVIVTAGADPALVHRVLDDAFAGEWGYEQMGYADWMAFHESLPGHDPDLWVLAEVDGVPASAMILSRRNAEHGGLHVLELATSRSHRRRGLASVLLRHAHHVAAGEGLTTLTLMVDGDNPHDAPALYRRAGFEVRTASYVFTRTLTA